MQVLTSSVIKIQNNGYTVIESGNISPDDPIRIHAKDEAKIYLTKILDVRGSANNFRHPTLQGNARRNQERAGVRGSSIPQQFFLNNTPSTVIKMKN